MLSPRRLAPFRLEILFPQLLGVLAAGSSQLYPSLVTALSCQLRRAASLKSLPIAPGAAASIQWLVNLGTQRPWPTSGQLCRAGRVSWGFCCDCAAVGFSHCLTFLHSRVGVESSSSHQRNCQILISESGLRKGSLQQPLYLDHALRTCMRVHCGKALAQESSSRSLTSPCHSCEKWE